MGRPRTKGAAHGVLRDWKAALLSSQAEERAREEGDDNSDELAERSPRKRAAAVAAAAAVSVVAAADAAAAERASRDRSLSPRKGRSPQKPRRLDFSDEDDFDAPPDELDAPPPQPRPQRAAATGVKRAVGKGSGAAPDDDQHSDEADDDDYAADEDDAEEPDDEYQDDHVEEEEEEEDDAAADDDDYDNDDDEASSSRPKRRRVSSPRKALPRSPRRASRSPTKRRRLESDAEADSDDDAPPSPSRRARSSGAGPELTLPARVTPLAGPSSDALENARSQLHVGAVPDVMPCRGAERDRIATFVRECARRGAGKCLYVSGMPGTGKTATVHQVVRELQTGEDAIEFDFVELNAMRMTEPAQAYSLLLRGLTKEKMPPAQALDRLDELFSGPRKKAKLAVVLVDEMDLLVTKKQTVIYNLFDWPHRQHARLAVIAVANTMDLPERTQWGMQGRYGYCALPGFYMSRLFLLICSFRAAFTDTALGTLLPRVSSRLGLARLVFASYTHTQLCEIILSRLGAHSGCFHADAVELCARKVAQISGDARRALDVCRRAVELAIDARQLSHVDEVYASHVSSAYAAMFNSSTATAIQYASKYERIFLCVLCSALRHAGVPETTYHVVADRFVNSLRVHSHATPNASEVFAICARLGARRLVLLESPLLDVYQRIRLNVTEDDVRFALAADKTMLPFIGN